ncbi:sensor histidine kinase [Allostreptomyces psammosilenae]|uniref:histidine kinase n=1 Tax=Allostreptomyces psammosilenae TaxID=1892865 RepID=A0A853A3S8_9ACTN|nr:histidine kinase [Allostreptomyces psammosilenae]NYI05162.1 signal transduction histidine kinase [Allostreptomyces psammosilenae]
MATWSRRLRGLGYGALLAPLELLLLVCGGLALGIASVHPALRRRALVPLLAGARRLLGLERRRLLRFFDEEVSDHHAPGATLRYLAARGSLGLLGAAVLGLMGAGLVLAVLVAATIPLRLIEGEYAIVAGLLPQILLGLVLLFLNVQGFVGLDQLERRLARHFLGPSPRELLERRITELAVSRAGVLEAVNAERRRIERDLHDGVQQRLVALAMVIGRARRSRSPEKTDELLRQAHEEAQGVLRDLREVAWRVYPVALDDGGGLAEALTTVAEHAGVPVRLDYGLGDRRLPNAIETVIYFVACEAVTNAVKHSRADTIRIEVRETVARPEPAGREEEQTVVVRVRDDGIGGADPAGGGLSGLARRVAALDGELRVDSPAAGGTTITAVLPTGKTGMREAVVVGEAEPVRRGGGAGPVGTESSCV